MSRSDLFISDVRSGEKYRVIMPPLFLSYCIRAGLWFNILSTAVDFNKIESAAVLSFILWNTSILRRSYNQFFYVTFFPCLSFWPINQALFLSDRLWISLRNLRTVYQFNVQNLTYFNFFQPLIKQLHTDISFANYKDISFFLEAIFLLRFSRKNDVLLMYDYFLMVSLMT